MGPRRIGTLTLVMLLASPGLCLAKGSPIKSKRSLDSKLAKVERDLAKEHAKLAKKLAKAKLKWETWIECKWALRIDPKNRNATKLLEKFPPFPPKKVNADYTKARGLINLEAKKDLGSLLERGQRGKLTNTDLEAVALRLLQYYPDHLTARQVMGFGGRARKWLNDRQRKLRLAYGKAFASSPAPKAVGNRFPNLAKALGASLKVFESEHCFVAGINIPDANLTSLSKAAETAYAAIHHDLFGLSGLFASPDARAATGVKLGKFNKPLYLVLENMNQHQTFLDKVVADPNLRARGKRLAFLATGFKADKILVLESRMGKNHLEEWGGLLMTLVVINQRFGRNRPPYLTQGLARYYSGQVSQRAFLKVVSGGTQSDADADLMRRGDFDQLRWMARWAFDHFRAGLPATTGVSKALAAMNRGDLGLATAFVEFLIAKHPGKLVKMLQTADGKTKRGPAALAEQFPEGAEALDKAFLEWFVRNY